MPHATPSDVERLRHRLNTLALVTLGSALATRQYGWAVLVTVFNAAFNLYPVLHQRHKRARVRRSRRHRIAS